MNKEGRKFVVKKLSTNLLKKSAELVFFLALLASLSGFFSKAAWVCNLFSHFPAQFALFFAITLLYYLKKKAYLQTALSALFLVLNLLTLSPYIIQSSMASHEQLAQRSEQTELKLMQINLLYHNTDFARISKGIKDKSPDLIAFEEINDKVRKGIDKERGLDNYPYSIVVPNESEKTEIALFSKRPFQTYSILSINKNGDRSIIAKIGLQNKKSLTVVVMHPRPPVSPKHLARQEKQLQSVIDIRKELGESVLVMGDLNTTPWAYPYKNFVSKMGLVDPRVGRGLLPTWPSFAPVLLIPIDHILASPDIRINKIELADFNGSDHLPLFVDCSI